MHTVDVYYDLFCYKLQSHLYVWCIEQEKASPEDDLLGLSDEDEAVASDLDMHALILSGLQAGGCDDDEPVKTAEEVLREIDDIMQVTHFLSKIAMSI
jgi:hypothetical protein